MAAMLFDKAGKQLRRLLLALGVFSIVPVLMYAAVPLVNSPVSVYVGKVFAAHSKKADLIFTNIKPTSRPYKASDVGGAASTSFAADRFITFGVSDLAHLCVAGDVVGEATRFQYWKLRSLPITPALEAELAARGKLLETLHLTFPDSREALPEKLRAFVWYSVMKKGKRPPRDSVLSSDDVDLYEITLPPEAFLPDGSAADKGLTRAARPSP